MRRKDNAQHTPAHRPTPIGAVRIRAWVLAALAAVFVFAPAARAQIVKIAPATTQSVTLSGAQIDEVDRFLAQYADNAFSDDRAVAKRALDELIDPLLGEGVSVAFRQAFADRVADKIRAVLEDPNALLEGKAINHKPYNALRLAGEIATDRTLALITGELKSDDTGRRYFAIRSVETVFYRMRTSAPAVTARTLLNRRQGNAPTGLIPDLGKMLSDEKSGRHASALVCALAEAAELPDDVVEGASSESIRLIGTGAAARIRATAGPEAPKTEDVLSWLTASQRIVRVIAQPGSADGPTALAAVRLGGQLIASVYRDLEAKRVAPGGENRDDDPAALVLSQMLADAENLLLFGEQNAAVAAGRRQNADLISAATSLREAFGSGSDSDFRRATLGLISPNGILTAAPYGFTDDEFIVE